MKKEIPLMDETFRLKYRWYMLALIALTGTFVTAIPYICMPVLFNEIGEDLGLSVVEIGTVWGMGNLAGIVISLIGGIIGDRISTKWLLGICSILVGVTGALRGLSTDFVFLSVTMLVNGIFRLIIPVNITRTTGLWFKGKNLGAAMGVGAMGMGLGLAIGPMISATVMSPLLGGWRNVLFLYGGISVFFGFLWLIFGKDPPTWEKEPSERVPLFQTLGKLIRMKSVWLIGLTLMMRTASMMGMSGYLSLYLKNQGWADAAADSTLSSFYIISTIFVIPLTALSDRIGSRKLILLLGFITNTVALGLLPLVDGGAVIGLILLAGMFMDGYMAINTTILMETKGIESRYTGAALGIIFTISNIGNVISPPVGNSFESIHPGLPFTFWAAISAVGLITLYFVKETGRRKKLFGTPSSLE